MNDEPTTGEYDAINFDGLERRANYRTIAYREDMLHVFGRRDGAAIIYHIIYRWQTDYKRADVVKEIERRKAARLPALTPEEVESRMWVYMSYNDFVRESGQAVAYNTVIRTLHYLIHDIKVIEQRDNHDPHYPDYEYRINKEVAKTLLKALPAEPAFTPKIPKKKEKSTQMGTDASTPTSTQMGTADTENQSTHLGTGSTQNGIASTHLGTGVYPNGGTSQITTQYPTEDNTEEESEGEQSDTTTSASSLPLDALTPLSSPQSENDTSPKPQEIARTCDTCGRPQTQADCPWCMTTRLPAIPKTPSLPSAVEPGRSGGPTPGAPAPLPGGTSHEQNRDALPGNVAVGCPGDRDKAGPGAGAEAPIPPVPSGSSPPRTMRATVVSPPPQVLVTATQFTSIEDWKQAQDAFVEILRGIWKTAGSDFKRQAGNWNAYRRQYLDRWLKANPEPLEVQFTPDGKTLFDEWCSLFKVKVDAGKANIEAANWLAEPCATWATLLNLSRTEVLRNEKDWCYANDKKGYFNRGVKLFDLKREFEGWQSYQQSLLDKAEREKDRPQNKYGTVSGLPRLEPSQEWLEAMGER